MFDLDYQMPFEYEFGDSELSGDEIIKTIVSSMTYLPLKRISDLNLKKNLLLTN